ncbi:hypothetical protein Y032_0245g3548 [Ancylostoma ceylanicum]|uniref:Uncharacterized protein n=1 Tax=Ancylostoma ceylanicum TaxID=53326 RepID=A0A016SCZ5_9BILA|nr:hypothetical protein Y032_0245g3548 [Ancylostoma ceylanicum]
MADDIMGMDVNERQCVLHITTVRAPLQFHMVMAPMVHRALLARLLMMSANKTHGPQLQERGRSCPMFLFPFSTLSGHF